ncbi:endoglucanase F-like [Saccoglossus kowalevskii]
MESRATAKPIGKLNLQGLVLDESSRREIKSTAPSASGVRRTPCEEICESGRRKETSHVTFNPKECNLRREDARACDDSVVKGHDDGVCSIRIPPYLKIGAYKVLKKTASAYDYDEVLAKSILFYEAQRSGVLPLTNRISWRGDSCINDKSHDGHDLSGGWYDAGDYVKFGLPMAWSTTVLAWGVIAYKDAYLAAGQLEYMLDCIKWPADYFLKCHTRKNEFYYQVGDGAEDHKRWGRAEEMDIERPSFKVTPSLPGSDVVGETVAALSATAIAFKDANKPYAALLLQNAKELYDFASTYRGIYPSKGHYQTKQYGCKLTWAAAWLYFATSDKKYIRDAKKFYKEFKLSRSAWAFAWGNSGPAVQLLMYILTENEKYRTDFSNYLDSWLPGGKMPYTPKGLVYRSDWGPLRYAASNSFLALLASDYGVNPRNYREFAKKQLHYILGDSGRSFVCGFGKNPPKSPHHRASSCPLPPHTTRRANLLADEPNPHTLYGGVVGGPGPLDNYVDDRRNYKMNEVACDYNAGFQSAIAGLKHLEITGQPF